jgi:hypothetical protein
MKPPIEMARTSVIVCVLILTFARATTAQCVPDPMRETSLSVMNASIHTLTIYMDGERRSILSPGELSASLIVAPGQHFLFAEASLDGDTLSASRTLVIPAGQSCTWTVTTPAKRVLKLPERFRDALARQAIVSLAGLD